MDWNHVFNMKNSAGGPSQKMIKHGVTADRKIHSDGEFSEYVREMNAAMMRSKNKGQVNINLDVSSKTAASTSRDHLLSHNTITRSAHQDHQEPLSQKNRNRSTLSRLVLAEEAGEQCCAAEQEDQHQE